MRRIVALAAAIVLGLAGCTSGSANTDTTATPSSSSTLAPKPTLSASPTQTAKSLATKTVVGSRRTSDGNAVLVHVDEPSVCVTVIKVKVDGFTPGGNTTITIKSDKGYDSSKGELNENDGTVFTAIQCEGYPLGNYMLSMIDVSSNEWAEVAFTSVA